MKETLRFPLLVSLVLAITGCNSTTEVAVNSETTQTSSSPEDIDEQEATNSETETEETQVNDNESNEESSGSNEDSEPSNDNSEQSNDVTPIGQKTRTGVFNPLSPSEAYVILEKGTEPQSNSGFTLTKDPGTYICRQCNMALYQAEHKFESHCGWPSFDDEIKGAVKRVKDADGLRTEIVCSNCDGHLGHVFIGEGFTKKDTRHCVNSISMKFVKKGNPLPVAIIAKDKEE